MRLIKTILCLILAAFVYVNGSMASGETCRPADEKMNLGNCVINDQYNGLYSYEVTYEDFHQAYTPELFNTSGVKSVKHENSDYRKEFDTDQYVYADGCVLNISSGMSLFYYNKYGDCYSQVLTYIGSTKVDTEEADLEGFPLDAAMEKCDQFLDQLGIDYWAPDPPISLSSGFLKRITDDMKTAYGEEGARYFHSFTEDTEAYYIACRQVLDGIKLAGTPQIQIVITRNGISYLEMSHIIKRINKTSPIHETPIWQDALSLFADNSTAVYSLPDSITVTYDLDEISVSYFCISDTQSNTVYNAHVFPGWYISGYETMSSGNKTRIRKVSDFYSIPDGIQYHPN